MVSNYWSIVKDLSRWMAGLSLVIFATQNQMGMCWLFLESQRRMENIPEESLINWASGKGLQSGKTLQVTIVLCI